jgi:hypothetical protein
MEVQYACRYWVDHLQKSNVVLRDGESESLHNRVHTFLNEHCLHWLEALSLMGNLSEGVLMVKKLESILTVSGPAQLEFTCFLRSIVYQQSAKLRDKACYDHPRLGIGDRQVAANDLAADGAPLIAQRSLLTYNPADV